MILFIYLFAGSNLWVIALFLHIIHHLAGLRPCEIFVLVTSY